MEIVEKGTKVRYHGSLSFGRPEEMVVIGHHPCFGGTRDDDGNPVIKYDLQYGRKMHDYVSNIRRESFTIITEEELMAQLDEYADATWLIEVLGETLGVCEGFEKMQKILIEAWKSETGITEDVDDDARVSVDLKFGQWVLIVNHLPLWDYTATKIPKL